MQTSLSSIIHDASTTFLLRRHTLATARNARPAAPASAYLVSPCSSAPFRWGRRSCLGLRTGVSPHFSMNSMREILALRGGYERGRVPLPSPMPPESGAPPHNTHPSMVPSLFLSLRRSLSFVPVCSRSLAVTRSFSRTHVAPNSPPLSSPPTLSTLACVPIIFFFCRSPLSPRTPLCTPRGYYQGTRSRKHLRDHR